jgi:TRAP-type C4-dicarboxylate transport system substrate-binding protein
MVTLSLTDDQVVDLVQQLPPAQQRRVLAMLAANAQVRREERMRQAEQRLRELAAARGLDWATLDEDAREVFIDDLLHEDR